MKKKKLDKNVAEKLVDLLTAKTKLEKQIVEDSRIRFAAESKLNESVELFEKVSVELSKVSNDLEKKYGKGSEFNIETGEIVPSEIFD
jgi:hypothetical protein